MDLDMRQPAAARKLHDYSLDNRRLLLLKRVSAKLVEVRADTFKIANFEMPAHRILTRDRLGVEFLKGGAKLLRERFSTKNSGLSVEVRKQDEEESCS